MKIVLFLLFGFLLTCAPLPVSLAGSAHAADPDLVLSGTMAEMTSPEVAQAAKEGAVVLFPVAIIEEHGPHLDLTPDIVLGAEVCRGIKARLAASGRKAVIVPPLYWGVSFTTHMFPGTFAVRPETMKAILADAVGCLERWGFKTVIFVNSHGDPTHGKAQAEAAAALRESLGIGVYAAHELKPKGYTPPPFTALPAGSYQPDYHAGAPETAAMAVLRPSSVRPEIAKTLQPQPTFLPLGYAGNPAGYTAVDGHAVVRFFIESEAERILAFLEEQSPATP